MSELCFLRYLYARGDRHANWTHRGARPGTYTMQLRVRMRPGPHFTSSGYFTCGHKLYGALSTSLLPVCRSGSRIEGALCALSFLSFCNVNMNETMKTLVLYCSLIARKKRIYGILYVCCAESERFSIALFEHFQTECERAAQGEAQTRGEAEEDDSRRLAQVNARTRAHLCSAVSLRPLVSQMIESPRYI